MILIVQLVKSKLQIGLLENHSFNDQYLYGIDILFTFLNNL